ncbi:MAG: hypothetical protein RIS94_521 [Pseudomonadota bacterium]|jgi:hypothetical protein
MITNNISHFTHSPFLPKIPPRRGMQPAGHTPRLSPVLSKHELREIVLQILG